MILLSILAAFLEIWLVDFEFHQPAGGCPIPICMVAHEVRSGRTIRLWQDDLRRAQSPFPVDERILVVAYFSSAELNCFLALGWQMPVRILDLYVEFRWLTSGADSPCGHGLLGAMAYFGLENPLAAAEKTEMRDLAIRGGPFTEDERDRLLAYCEEDVLALSQLLPAMANHLDLPRALLRGRYMAAVARMERNGIPLDSGTVDKLRQFWPSLQDHLIQEVDSAYHVYEGRTFKVERFSAYLDRMGYSWPRTDLGALKLDDDTFRDMSKTYPDINPLRELRHSLGELRLNSLVIGRDGRNRCLLSPFGSKTGRNQPSNSKFIFGPAVWLRGLILPSTDSALAYIDWEQQEFGIAASLSGDTAMMEAYQSGDPYLSFAKQAKAVPAHATKASHSVVRDQFKVCALAVQYGMGADSLAFKLNKPPAYARELLRLHRETYSTFWRWSESVVSHAMLHNSLHSVFGWRVQVGANANPRSLANFPMQANGAEMLRLACCLATESGIRVCAPIHDALLIEGPVHEIDQLVQETSNAMGAASECVLNGFRLRTDSKIIRYPDRYADERGAVMWKTVMGILDSHERRAAGNFDPDSKR